MMLYAAVVHIPRINVRCNAQHAASRPHESGVVLHVAGASLIKHHAATLLIDVILGVACRTLMGDGCDLNAEVKGLLEWRERPE